MLFLLTDLLGQLLVEQDHSSSVPHSIGADLIEHHKDSQR